MFIQFNSFIPTRLGKSLFGWINSESEKYPLANRSQILRQAVGEGSRRGSRTWIKEPVNDLTYCTTDGRDFGEHNLFQTGGDSERSRLYFYSGDDINFNRKGIDLNFIGSFKSFYKTFPFQVQFGTTYKAGVSLRPNHGRSVQNTRDGLLAAKPSMGCHYGQYRARDYIGYFFADDKQLDASDAWFQRRSSFFDVNKDSSIIIVNGEGGYPFAEPLSPNIDMSLKIIFKRRADHYDIEFVGFHNSFPFYEILIDGKTEYRFESSDKGPSPFNLNTRVSFRFSLRIPKIKQSFRELLDR